MRSTTDRLEAGGILRKTGLGQVLGALQASVTVQGCWSRIMQPLAGGYHSLTRTDEGVTKTLQLSAFTEVHGSFCDSTSEPITVQKSVGLEVEEVIGPENQQQGNGCDSDLADSSHDERPGSLFEKIFQVRAQSYAGKGEQEGPAA